MFMCIAFFAFTVQCAAPSACDAFITSLPHRQMGLVFSLTEQMRCRAAGDDGGGLDFGHMLAVRCHCHVHCVFF